MTRACSTSIASMLLVPLAVAALRAQPVQPTAPRGNAPTFGGRAAAPVPEKISLLTVDGFMSEVGGRYITMPPVTVQSALSPRLFAVRGTLFPYDDIDDDDRPLVLLASPAPNLGPGAEIEVTGWVATLATASQVLGRDWGGTLDEDFFEDGNRPVIVANVVRALDGAEIYSRP